MPSGSGGVNTLAIFFMQTLAPKQASITAHLAVSSDLPAHNHLSIQAN
jgi:hypothetical protein